MTTTLTCPQIKEIYDILQDNLTKSIDVLKRVDALAELEAISTETGRLKSVYFNLLYSAKNLDFQKNIVELYPNVDEPLDKDTNGFWKIREKDMYAFFDPRTSMMSETFCHVECCDPNGFWHTTNAAGKHQLYNPSTQHKSEIFETLLDGEVDGLWFIEDEKYSGHMYNPSTDELSEKMDFMCYYSDVNGYRFVPRENVGGDRLYNPNLKKFITDYVSVKSHDKNGFWHVEAEDKIPTFYNPHLDIVCEEKFNKIEYSDINGFWSVQTEDGVCKFFNPQTREISDVFEKIHTKDISGFWHVTDKQGKSRFYNPATKEMSKVLDFEPSYADSFGYWKITRGDGSVAFYNREKDEICEESFSEIYNNIDCNGYWFARDKNNERVFYNPHKKQSRSGSVVSGLEFYYIYTNGLWKFEDSFLGEHYLYDPVTNRLSR